MLGTRPEGIATLEPHGAAQQAFALVLALSRRDPVTGSHLQRLPIYTHLLATELGSHPRHRAVLRRRVEFLPKASTLHDVGKLHVPEAILRKRGALTATEFTLMKHHTTAGGRALRELARLAPADPFLALGQDIALYHHERWDGRGYPFGLRRSQIPVSARIVALADVYDALTSERSYKPAYSHDMARSLIVAQSGAHFDPDLVEAFRACEDDFLRQSTMHVAA
jgi:putative two-component system response regulator